MPPTRSPYWSRPNDHDGANPLRLITIGVGINNYNDYLLEQLAQHGNGWYRYLSDTREARATFSRESWLALSIPFADQTRAQVRWDPGRRGVLADDRIREPRHLRRVPSPRPARSSPKFRWARQTTVFYELELVDDASVDSAPAW